MNKKLAGWAASSGNPEEISMRIKGGIVALSSVIILVASTFFHIQIGANDVLQLATLLGTVGGLTASLYGAGLALVRWVATVKGE